MSAAALRRAIKRVQAACAHYLAWAGVTAPLDRHGAWMAERARLFAYANSIDSESIAFDQACHRLNILDGLIIDTPVANAAEALAKLQLPVSLDAEGTALVGEDAAALIIDVAPFLTLEG